MVGGWPSTVGLGKKDFKNKSSLAVRGRRDARGEDRVPSRWPTGSALFCADHGTGVGGAYADLWLQAPSACRVHPPSCLSHFPAKRSPCSWKTFSQHPWEWEPRRPDTPRQTCAQASDTAGVPVPRGLHPTALATVARTGQYWVGREWRVISILSAVPVLHPAPCPSASLGLRVTCFPERRAESGPPRRLEPHEGPPRAVRAAWLWEAGRGWSGAWLCPRKRDVGEQLPRGFLATFKSVRPARPFDPQSQAPTWQSPSLAPPCGFMDSAL